MSKKQRRYTERERAQILAAAGRARLTWKQASKTLGVSEVTTWKWRRDANETRRLRRPREHRSDRAASGPFNGLLRSQVRARVSDLLPGIVREEVDAFLRQAVGHRGVRGQSAFRTRAAR